MHLFKLLSLPLAFVAAASADKSCSRKCLSNMVDEVLASMLAYTPYTLPLANPFYKATENGHPAALSYFQAWRTIVSLSKPSLLALDVKNGSAYFALDINEGNPALLNILMGRIAVVNQTITEIEIFINRARVDQGFSFDSANLPQNYAAIMDVPSNATLPTRKELIKLSTGIFTGADYAAKLAIGCTCQFAEAGSIVVADGGPAGNGTYLPLGCGGVIDDGPFDYTARTGLVIDEELGFAVQIGMIPGGVYAWRNESAFIPDALPSTFVETWINSTIGDYPLLYTQPASGETVEVLQYYDGALQAIQQNVFMHPPNATSAWL